MSKVKKLVLSIDSLIRQDSSPHIGLTYDERSDLHDLIEARPDFDKLCDENSGLVLRYHEFTTKGRTFSVDVAAPDGTYHLIRFPRAESPNPLIKETLIHTIINDGETKHSHLTAAPRATPSLRDIYGMVRSTSPKSASPSIYDASGDGSFAIFKIGSDTTITETGMPYGGSPIGSTSVTLRDYQIPSTSSAPDPTPPKIRDSSDGISSTLIDQYERDALNLSVESVELFHQALKTLEEDDPCYITSLRQLIVSTVQNEHTIRIEV